MGRGEGGKGGLERRRGGGEGGLRKWGDRGECKQNIWL